MGKVVFANQEDEGSLLAGPYFGCEGARASADENHLAGNCGGVGEGIAPIGGLRIHHRLRRYRVRGRVRHVRMRAYGANVAVRPVLGIRSADLHIPRPGIARQVSRLRRVGGQRGANGQDVLGVRRWEHRRCPHLLWYHLQYCPPQT